MNKLLTLLCLCFMATGHAASLGEMINAEIRTQLPQAHIGIMVIDAEQGNLLYGHNAEHYFSPASNIKLFTAAASLFELGPDYQFKTTLSWPKNSVEAGVLSQNLDIIFSGDPSLTIKNLQDLLAQLAKQGIREIKANIILDTTIFQGSDLAPGISADDLPWYYAAPNSAVVLDKNAFAYDLTPANQLGKIVSIKARSPYAPKIIHNNLVTVTKDRAELCPEHIQTNANNQLILNGCWPINDRSDFIRLAVTNPLHLAEQVILAQLKQSNIKFSGKILPGKANKNNSMQLTHRSEPLKQIIRTLLIFSDNVTAGNLTRLLGHKRYRRGTFAAGSKAIQVILAEHTNIDTHKLKIAEGSGTRYNLVTPKQITQLLFALWHDPKLKTIFINALPIAGKQGTLTNRMKSAHLTDRIRAKTGSMHDTAAISGYVFAKKPLIVALISNHIITGASTARAMENQLLELILQNT